MKSVKEILDDRSAETSSRPSLYAADVVTEKKYIPLANPDNHVWRMGRKAIQPLVAPQAVLAHLPVAEAETTQLLHDIIHDPEELCHHVSRYTFSFIASVVFGKSAPRHDSPELTHFNDYMRHQSSTVSPEAAPVDLIPILKYVPERWAPWKQLWRETRRLQRSLYFSFLEHAEKKIKSGSKGGTFIENILDRQEELKLTREMVAYIGGILIDGGADTSASLIQSLVHCLIRSPASLRKAQKEIDNIVGYTRLPLASDIPAVPFVQALIKEVHRVRPAAPTGIPHATSDDFEYRGYLIPKGAPIIINVWGIMHDPDLFDRPDEFLPERYMLTPDGTKPGLDKDFTIRSSLPFGSGKRLCPGMHLATTNLTLAVMRLLWAFDFAPLSGSVPQSGIWNMEDEYIDGLTFTPKSFKCKVTPRDKERVEVIEDYYNRITHAD
ncbi:hypothetical protein CVT25_012648 [Psilocybe cyanescens]|uniref:Cytochrome P450 n=1 Tax=Psilocybe cyanescens TaxID=93625 RepID=A0A409X4F0_PSICY|nr:hypothetical protein CVT25_012648 [Psilocybe cyanescens]